GMMTPEGDVIFESEFKEQPTVVVNGMFSVKAGDDNYALYNIDDPKKEVATGFTGIGCFAFEKVAPAVKKDKPISIIDKNGEEVVSLGESYSEAHGYFSDGLLVVGKDIVTKKDGYDETTTKYGAVNKDGEEKIEAKYASLTDFVDGVAVATLANDKGETTYYLVNKDGEETAVSKASEISEFQDGVALMTVTPKDGGKSEFYFINKKGEEVFKVSGDGVASWNKDYFVFLEGTSYGLKKLNEDQEKLITAKYKDITILGNGNLLVKEGDEYTIVNKDGEKVADKFSYKKAGVLGNGDYFLVNEGDNYIVVDKNGEAVDKKQTVYGYGSKKTSGSLTYTKKSND
ncbi:MAG: WG repeat-containing protein, partial [Muribaculaceae bacterium]|nr:WG repeat-containing protein [Muribaculaceae bacterium]